ncbi:TTL-domain-containing protein [Scleroderma citrinum]
MGDPQSTALVSWPSAPLTDSLVRQALADIENIEIVSSIPHPPLPSKLLQWAAYDDIDHSLTASDPRRVLSSSYTIRKALIRKHFLARCIQAYLLKHPESVLFKSVPRTWDIEVSYADELDELWSDELWELGNELDAPSPQKWYILKPGMADRGMGIRLFNSKDTLYKIFEEFDGCSDDEDEDNSTLVLTSQLRHFVIQEYVTTPLLLDPNEVSLSGDVKTQNELRGHKFHLRTYVVVSGAVTVYMYKRNLALFSSEPYSLPKPGSPVSLIPHLTNTSLQICRGEENVRLFDEISGNHILSDKGRSPTLNEEDIADIQQQMAQVLAEVFKAAIEQPVHFQPLPNAFELYGVDFLVSHIPHDPHNYRFQVNILEINAEPAIELTGPRLTWILEDLFRAIETVCVEPFVRGSDDKINSWNVGEVRYMMQKCLDMQIHSTRWL